MSDVVDAKALRACQSVGPALARSASHHSIAVVGATCPLGRHLIEALLASGHSVLALSRSMQKVPLAWKANPRILNRAFDLRDPIGLTAALRDSAQVIWLAHATEQRLASPEPDPNVVALDSVCRAGALFPRRIILVSSGGSVYGPPSSLPVAEQCLRNPKSAYGLVKKRMEDTLETATERQGWLSGIILRPGNIYGKYYLNPGAKGCIGAFARALLANQPITLVAGGRAVRDFIHVDDVVSAVFAVMASDRSFAIWNVGSGVGTKVQKVLQMMSSLLNRIPIGINDVTAPPTDVNEIVLSTTRIRTECSWSPVFTLPTGLRNVLLSRSAAAPSVSRTGSLAKARDASRFPTYLAF